MRVLILTDSDFALREDALLRRLEIGLADAGVRVIRAVPDSLQPHTFDGVYAQVVPFEETGLPFTRSARAARLAQAVSDLPGRPGEKPLDVVHVFGESVWPIAVETARRLKAGLVVEVFQARSIPALSSLSAEAGRGMPIAAVAVDAAIQRRAAVEAGLALPVRTAPWGVHLPRTPREILQPAQAPALILAATGDDRPALHACVEGIAAAARQRELVCFIDADAAHRAHLWDRITDLRLADRVSLVPEPERYREPTLRADVLILPESLGDHRSLTLDAMGSGMAVVAAADPFVSCLVDQQTARVVKVPSAQAWASAVGELLDHPATARALARGAREHLASEHKVSRHIASLQDAYEWIAQGSSLPYRTDESPAAGR